jgi:predicted DNA-binding transcriptional regulator YafY
VEPYGLVGRYGRWYLVAFCHLRVDFRTFRLDRIRHAQPRDERFTKKEDFDFRAYAIEHLTTAAVKWILKVVFPAPIGRVREIIPASLGTLTQTPEGVCLEWPIDDLDYGARYLVSRGVPFVVQGPPEFRGALRKLAEEASRIASTGEVESGTIQVPDGRDNGRQKAHRTRRP